MSSGKLYSFVAALFSNMGPSSSRKLSSSSVLDSRLIITPSLFAVDGQCQNGKASKAHQRKEELWDGLVAMLSTPKDSCKPNALSPVGGGFLRERPTFRITPDTIVYINCLIVRLCDSGMEDSAKSLLVEMIDHDLLPDELTLSNLINALHAKGKVEQALEVLEMVVLRSEFCRAPIFNVMLDGYFRIGKTEEAISLFDSMVLSELVNSAGMPNEATYATMFHGLCKEGRTHIAEKMFLDLKHSCRTYPDAVIYGSFIDALCKQGCAAKASELLSEMLYSSIKPDVSVFASVIDVLLVHGHLGEAQYYFKKMVYAHPFSGETVICTVLLVALSDQGYLGKARKLFLELHSGTCSCGRYLSIEMYSVLIDLLNSSGNDKEAKMLVKGTGECESYWVLGVAEDHKKVFNNLCKKGCFDEALFMMKVMVVLWSNTLDSVECSSLINGLCSDGRLSDALEVLDTAERYWCYECDAGTYNTLMDGYCKEGMFEDAFNLLLEMEDKGFSPNFITLNALVGGFARQKEGAKVEELLQRMNAMKISPGDLNINKFISSECLNKDENSNSASANKETAYNWIYA